MRIFFIYFSNEVRNWLWKIHQFTWTKENAWR